MNKSTTKIDINNNIIQINDKYTNVSVFDLYREFNKKFNVAGKFDASDFQKLNQMLNRADCIKDGTNGVTITQLGLFGADENSFSKDNLKTLAHDVINYFEDKEIILRNTFTRNKKGDNTVKDKYKGLSFDIGFDSGLGLDNFLIDTNYKVIDTFGKYIDPSTTRHSDEKYPQNTLIITENIFNVFGYDNCHINEAIYMSKDKYNYNIKISGTEMTNFNTPRNNDQNINTYFVGNKEKNKEKNLTDKKRAMVVGKSLGDKLQVLIMFIKKIQEKESRIIALSTCDEIVTLFCILLNVPCFYTSKEKEKENRVKINKVLYYNMDNTNPQKAATRFENEKKIVVDGYNNMILLINEIRETKSPLKITVDNREYKVSPVFLNGMIMDLSAIKLDIEKISISNENITEINNLIQKIKNITINNFIYKGKGKGKSDYLITQAKQYTRYVPSGSIIDTAYGKVNLLQNLNIDPKNINKNIKLSFFELLKQSQTPPSVIAQGGENNSRKRKSSSASPSTKSVVYKNIEEYFNTDEIIVYLKPDEIVNPSDENVNSDTLEYYDISSFDANRTLLDTLYDLYINMNSRVPFEDIYSEMLCLFNSDPNYYTEHLKQQMEVIEKELQSAFTLPNQKSEKQMDISPVTLSNQKSEKQMDISPGMVNKIPSRTRKLSKRHRTTKKPNKKNIRIFTRKKLLSIFNKPQTNNLRNLPESINITSIL